MENQQIITGETSDGYHTFNDLYEHRSELFCALLRILKDPYYSSDCWRSKLHYDGTMLDGYFIAGIGTTPGEIITYHLEMKYWKSLDTITTFHRAPEWDGHTSNDVLHRLTKIGQ